MRRWDVEIQALKDQNKATKAKIKFQEAEDRAEEERQAAHQARLEKERMVNQANNLASQRADEAYYAQLQARRSHHTMQVAVAIGAIAVVLVIIFAIFAVKRARRKTAKELFVQSNPEMLSFDGSPHPSYSGSVAPGSPNMYGMPQASGSYQAPPVYSPAMSFTGPPSKDGKSFQ